MMTRANLLKILSALVLFGAWEIAGRVPVSLAFPTFLESMSALFRMAFDGTLWTDDEMVLQGVGQKTGKRMGHMSMSGPEGSIAAYADLDVQRKVFVHINNTNPVWRDGPERAEAQAAGWEIGYDGMEIVL